MEIKNTKINIMLMSIALVFLTNFLYNMSELRYYTINQNNIPIINLGVMVGAVLTIIIEFYGTYLILEKHFVGKDESKRWLNMNKFLSYRFYFYKKIVLSKGIIVIDKSKYMDIRNIFDLSALIKQLKPLQIERIQ